ncbi:MAG: hypothetical protein R2861_02175 [Desulfobacterales bacterium]
MPRMKPVAAGTVREILMWLELDPEACGSTFSAGLKAGVLLVSSCCKSRFVAPG